MQFSIINLDLIGSRRMKDHSPAQYLEIVEKMLRQRFYLRGDDYQISRGDSLQLIVPTREGMLVSLYIFALLKSMNVGSRMVIGEGAENPEKLPVWKIHQDDVVVAAGDELALMDQHDLFRIVRREKRNWQNDVIVSRYFEMIVSSWSDLTARCLILALEGFNQDEVAKILSKIEKADIGQSAVSKRLARAHFKRVEELLGWWNVITDNVSEVLGGREQVMNDILKECIDTLSVGNMRLEYEA